MKQYLDVLQKIKDEGVEKSSGRENMPNTIGISHAVIKMDLQDGFPLLTTKRMYWKGIIHELLWILRGDTNIKYLVDNNVNIWNNDAHRWYQQLCKDAGIEPLELKPFLEKVKNDEHNFGNLGKVYGYQWRNQNGVDQVKDVYESLTTNPFSRYHIIDAWNKAEFKDMALPPCHLLYQFIVRPTDENTDGCQLYLDLNMYQRSCDTFLGVPFNIASMSLLLKIFAKACGMFEGVATWIGGDTHLYKDHMDAVDLQLSRTPGELPTLNITKDLNSFEDIMKLTIDDFELLDYDPQPTIKAELFVGKKK